MIRFVGQAFQPDVFVAEYVRLESLTYESANGKAPTMPSDVRERDKATRKFYEHFKCQRAEFLECINGISDRADREWYASLTLHRLMFLYFLQGKGFLDGNVRYLKDRLARMQGSRGKRKSPTFYRSFLLWLFHDGLSKQHGAELPDLLGKVPYLGGGLFDVHTLERKYSDGERDIPDAAFAKLFAFFDRYDWCLDSRHPVTPHAITPDVLGNVFEKFVNQKQMGAYYTKQDITEYISKNTIIPHLFDVVEKRCPGAFRIGAPLWKQLQANADRYLHHAMRHGVIDEAGQVIPLPAHIEADRPALPPHARPTETWREYLARRRRCLEIRDNVRCGKISTINDFITYNLDIRRFAADSIAASESSELAQAFYQAITTVKVLDPTCGSGAFLLAALDILQPLHEACLARLNRAGSVSDSSSARYSILKSIILNNLYGVDIMAEAVDICKVRLFLRLVAQFECRPNEPNFGLEPLLDIDFNIRHGNMLVGSTNLDDAGSSASTDQLDRSLADAYGINARHSQRFARWRARHQPFHWSAEFGAIMRKGGFDVIIGNPPYLKASKVTRQYSIQGYRTIACPDVYAWCLERCTTLLAPDGRTGMIVPLSLGFSADFAVLRRLLLATARQNWFASFGRIPSALFSHDVRVRNIIHIASRTAMAAAQYTTRLHRWFEEARPCLFERLEYAPFDPQVWREQIPKLGTTRLSHALERALRCSGHRIKDVSNCRAPASALYFKKTAYNWLAFTPAAPPSFGANDQPTAQSQLDKLPIVDGAESAKLFLLLNGKLVFLFWCIVGDDFHVTRTSLADFPIPAMTAHGAALNRIAEDLRGKLDDAVSFKRNAGKRVGNYNLASCRAITDQSDLLFARSLGLEEVWDEIELFYGQMVRTEHRA